GYIVITCFGPFAVELMEAAAADGVVAGFGMVDDDGGGGLLWDELIGRAEGHAQVGFGRQKVEHLAVLGELGDGGITPGVALAAAGRQVQLAANVAVNVLGR